jgi:O-antigen polymerase
MQDHVQYIYGKRYASGFVLIAILSILVWTPFATDRSMIYPSQYGQFFFFLQCTIVLLAAYAFRSGGIRATIAPIVSVIDLILLFIVVYGTIITVIAYSGFSNAPLTIFEAFGLLIFYLSVRSSDNNCELYFLFAILGCGAAQAIYGNLQLYDFFPSYSSVFRITGSFFNPAPFSGFLSTIFPVAVGAFLFRKSLTTAKWARSGLAALSLVAILSILVILPAADSRAGLLSLVISSIYMLLHDPGVSTRIRKALGKKGKIILLASAALFLFILLFVLYFLRKDSADGRVLIWRVSAPLLLKSPVVGIGFDKFKADYMQSQANYFTRNPANRKDILISDNVQYPYNEYLHTLIEFGILGLSAGILMITLCFRARIIEKYRPYAILARGGLISICCFSFFSYTFEILPILVLGTLFVSIVAKYSSDYRLDFSNLKLPRLYGVKLITAILVIAGLPFVWIAVKRVKNAYSSWGLANYYYQNRQYDNSVKYYSASYSLLSNNGFFLNHYGKALSLTSEYDRSIATLIKSLDYLGDEATYLALGDDYKALKKYDSAQICYKKAYYMTPSHMFPKYCLAKLYYYQMGLNTKALSMAVELLESPVKVESPAAVQMQDEMKQMIKAIKEKS